MADADARNRIVIAYAVWATLCTAVAGVAIALIHTAFFSFHPGRSAVVETFVSGLVAGLGLAAAQGAVALVTGGLLARFDRTLHYTVLLGLILGLFDLVMYFVQMAVPVTELGWIPDIAILLVTTIAITAAGSRKAAAVV